jgi:hypothetical protein
MCVRRASTVEGVTGHKSQLTTFYCHQSAVCSPSREVSGWVELDFDIPDPTFNVLPSRGQCDERQAKTDDGSMSRFDVTLAYKINASLDSECSISFHSEFRGPWEPM